MNNFFKKNKLPIILGGLGFIFVVVVSVVISSLLIINHKKEKEEKKITEKIDQTSNTTPIEKEDFYIYGKAHYNNGRYSDAIEAFEKIRPEDKNYKEAQNYIKLSIDALKKLEIKNATIDKQKESMKNKYEKLCKSGLYKFQIVERLKRDNFYLESSDFGKAPDGGTGIKQVFRKSFDGFIVYVSLQDSYDISTYYYDVWVE